MKKKILAIFLSLCMAMSLLPVTALAAGNDETETQTPTESSIATEGALKKAIEDAQPGDTVTLGGDIAITAPVVINKRIILDLNEKKIYAKKSIWNEDAGRWSLISVGEGGDLIVTGNGTLQAKKGDTYAIDVNGGSCTIENGTFVGNVHAVYVLQGTLVVKDGTFSVQQKYSEAQPYEFVLNCYDSNYKNGSAKITVYGGSFEGFNPRNCQAEGGGTNFCAPGYVVDVKKGQQGTDLDTYTVRKLDEGSMAVFPAQSTEGIVSASLEGTFTSSTKDIQESETEGAPSGKVSGKDVSISLITGERNASAASLKVATDTAQSLANNANALTVESDVGTVSLDSAALDKLANVTAPVVISISKENSETATWEVTVTSGTGENNEIFGEALTTKAIEISVPYTAEGASSEDTKVYCIDNGMEDMGATYDATEKELTWTTSHLSTFAAVTLSSGQNITYTTESGVASTDNLSTALSSVKDGGTITMLKEYDATSEGTITFNADKDVTLDLGGFELTLSRFNLVQGWLTVENGRVKSNPDNGQAFNVYAGSTATDELYTKLVIEDDVTINAAYGICLFPGSGNAGYSSAIEVYGNIATGGIFVSGNLGNDTSTAGNMVSSNKIPTVTIYDGAVVNNGTEGQGIAMNGLANVTVNGGTISGSEAIGVKRGTLTVNGGDFNSNGAYVDPIEANNNGTENTGATISITSTYNYAGTIGVNINGGTFTSENAPAVYLGHSKKNGTTNSYNEGVSLNIQGGTFISPANVTPVYVADQVGGDAENYTQEVVSGGNFSDSVDKKFLNDSIKAELKSAANTEAPYSYYTSMEAALAAAQPGDVVVAIGDIGNETCLVTVKNGDKIVDHADVIQNGMYILPDAPSRAGYSFCGWYGNGHLYAAGEAVQITKDTTFVAQWSDNTPYYTITVKDADNGTVTCYAKSAAKGADVTLNVKADVGYQLDKLTVTDASGKTVAVEKVNNTTYTFVMPGSKVTVEAVFAPTTVEPSGLPFTDVSTSDWFYGAVKFVYENGLMDGVGDNRFAPNSATTRGMLVTILYRLEGEPAVTGEAGFDDVGDTWYTDAVIWAAANDIVNGIGDNQFGPENTLTREQLVTMLYRYAQNKGYDVTASADLSGYPDADKIQSWAQEAMTWAVAEGIVEGMDGNLNPAGSATRAQIATILMRFCEGVGK